MRTRSHSGFTLIELSIVLVIIGLLVGGVFVARDLIEAANMRKDMATIEKYNTAVNTFKLKYNALPGDMTNPTQFGFDANAYGDGNGRIQGDYVSVGGSALYRWDPWGGLRPEWFYVGHHLGRARLIDLSGEYTFIDGNQIANVAYPKMYSSPGSFTFQDTQGSPAGILLSYEETSRVSGHFFRMGACRYASSLMYVAFNCGFDVAKAQQIDSKYDDGQALNGIIQIGPLLGSCPNDVFDTSTAACRQGGVGDAGVWFHCALDTTQNYDTAYGIRSCSLRVKASF